MVNTINTLIEKNKELLNKIEELERELEDRDFPKLISKVREWTGEKEGVVYASCDLAQYYLVDEDNHMHYGCDKEIVDKLDTLEYVKSLIRATKFFNKRHWEWHWEKVKKINALEKEKETYFKELVEKRTENKEQALKIEELEKNLKEKELVIENLEVKLEETELKEQTHIEAFEVSERWNKDKEKVLRKETADKSELLEKSRDTVEIQNTKIIELEKSLKEKSELLEEAHEVIEKQKVIEKEELDRKSYLNTETLPSLPKKQSKFKKAGAKLKTNLQQLVKKVKSQNQELIARIEVKTK